MSQLLMRISSLGWEHGLRFCPGLWKSSKNVTKL
jgi:hypothetical protein